MLIKESIMSPYSRSVETALGPVLVEGPLTAGLLAELEMHVGLKMFRPPKRQKEALISIAGLPGGRVTVARRGETIAGYACFHPPDSFERWSTGNQGDVLVMGIEVAREYRGGGLGKAILGVTFEDPEMEKFIVISTEYCWHWDLEGSGLSPFQYRDMLTRVFSSVGMQPRGTDEEDIASHPANMLMVRIGSQIPFDRAVEFESLRYRKHGII